MTVAPVTVSKFKFGSIYTIIALLGLQLYFFIYVGFKIFTQSQTRNKGLILTYVLFLIEVLSAIAYQNTFIVNADKADDPLRLEPVPYSPLEQVIRAVFIFSMQEAFWFFSFQYFITAKEL